MSSDLSTEVEFWKAHKATIRSGMSAATELLARCQFANDPDVLRARLLLVALSKHLEME